MSKGLDVAALLQKMRNNRFEKIMFSSFVWDWVTFVIKNTVMRKMLYKMP